MSADKKGKVRYAVVGAGWFGQAAILPAFPKGRENSELVAIVSGDEEKRDQLGSKYGVDTFTYHQYDSLLASGKIDAVYIATPNSQHREHAVAAANRGIHVLCEKPLADTVANATAIVDACAARNVHLMTAYRLHFEKGNLTAIEEIRKGTIGTPRLYHSSFTQQVTPGNTRIQADLGGHVLLDIGIYSINAARYLFQADPVEVSCYVDSLPGDERFKEVPEMATAMLRFPEHRLATINVGFGESAVATAQVIGTKGDLKLDPAFSYQGKRTMHLTIGGKTKETSFPDVDQIAAEIVAFSNAIRGGDKVEPDGHEGLIDVTIITALRESAATGRSVKLPAFHKDKRPGIDQQMKYSQHREASLVNAEPASIK